MSKNELAEAFGKDTDPLAQYAAKFEQVDTDPFDIYTQDVLHGKNRSDSTIYQYKTTFDQWRGHMATEERHPACPNEGHVRSFIDKLQREGKAASTINDRLKKLDRVYRFWQVESWAPHGDDFNPFGIVRAKVELKDDRERHYPKLSVADLQEGLKNQKHIWRKTAVAFQLKLGLRSGEVENCEIQDLHIDVDAIKDHYPEMGTNPRLEYKNAIYIPSKKEREGNKSEVARTLPLDTELREQLTDYLLVRPDNGDPHLFLGIKEHGPIGNDFLNRAWTETYPEYQYPKDSELRSVTSHFGRHFFTTYWKIHRDMNRQLVMYMRGDTMSSGTPDGQQAIDEYLHTYYTDIEEQYREEVYPLGL